MYVELARLPSEKASSPLALARAQVVLYSLPELDGAIDTVVLGGLVGDRIALVPERVRKMNERVKGWVELRRTPSEDRRIAILVYGFPPNVGAVRACDAGGEGNEVAGRVTLSSRSVAAGLKAHESHQHLPYTRFLVVSWENTYTCWSLCCRRQALVLVGTRG